MIEYMICGMPRSRTAWMSAFLSDSESICLHEAVNGCYNNDQYFDRFSGIINGDSTTAAKIIKAHEIDCKKIVLLRDPKDSKLACDGKFGDVPLDYYIEQHDYLLEIGDIIIDYRSLDENLDLIWSEVKKSPFNPDKSMLFSGLNIQVNYPYEFDGEAAKSFYA